MRKGLMRGPGAAAVVAVLGACAAAHAQQGTTAEATPQPGKDRFSFRQTLHVISFRDDPSDLDRSGTELRATTNVVYGLTGSVALSFSLPLVYRYTDFGDGSDSNDKGIADPTLLVRWRVWQDDSAAVDTRRIVLLAGMELPSGDDPFTSDSFDPIIGAVYSMISGKHGFNASLQWKFTTGGMRDPISPGETTADLLRYDAAYLYRLAPEVYAADTAASVYAQLELNGYYETNDDHEVFLSPGLLYEGTTWAAEISVQLPVARRLDHRPERDWILVVGFRLLF